MESPRMVAASEPLQAPFPYFGGKRKVAAEIWRRFGAVDNYVEPFLGSGAVLLNRPGFTPDTRWIETVNDADGFLANFWRALRADPEAVAYHADYPVIENDLDARHGWLVQQRADLTERLHDPEYCDPKLAGWWVWGISAWIGGGWCSGRGPWQLIDGRLVDTRPAGGNAGLGINRQRPHLGNCGGWGRGGGQGIFADRARPIPAYFRALAARLENVRVCCGDWSRVCGPSVTHKHGVTAVFLDPPYADTAGRDPKLYAVECLQVAHAVREWAIANGRNPMLRIALAGYEGEHDMPADWSVYAWNAGAGFGGQAAERTGNGKRERVWFSPHCLTGQPDLFEAPQ